MANPFTGTGSTPQARAQSLGYSTGSPRTGGGKSAGGGTNTALANAIKQSQAKFPSAWAKATGTTDKTKQFNQVTGKSGTSTESFTLSNKQEVDKKIKELRDYARTFGSGHYMPSILYKQANELEAKGYDSNAKTFTPEPKTLPSIYGGQFVPDKPPVVQTTEGVTLTGISEGATVTFLNPTTASTVTQPTIPSGSGMSQTEYNILTQQYDKETADKLATQTYLTPSEVKELYPQFDIEPTPKTSRVGLPCGMSMSQYEGGWQCIDGKLIAPPPKLTAIDYGIGYSKKVRPSPRTPVSSTISILPIIIVAVALIGILLFLRRKA